MYEPYSVTISADIERPDRLLGPFTARQLAILVPGLALVWAAFVAVRTLVPLAVFAGFAIPALGVVAALALAERDGIGLDQLALHALAYARHPRRLAPAPGGIPGMPAWATAPEQAGPPPAPLRLPAHAIGAHGTISLGGDGVAVIVAATTVSFTLRTPAEQAALVGAFGGWLNSLAGPIQILVQAAPIDLAPPIAGLRDQAAGLPHAALEDAALDHAQFLSELAATRDLLARRVFIVLREPAGTIATHSGGAGAGRGATTITSGGAAGRGGDVEGAAVRALRRAEQAVRALAAAGIAATALAAEEATAVLAAGADPTAPAMTTHANAHVAAPDEPITASGGKEVAR
jgi:hypothetical protein